MKKFISLSWVFFVFISGGCNTWTSWFLEDRYIARVNGDVITEYDFKKKLEGFHTVKDIGKKMQINIPGVDYRKIVEEMIGERLMVQEALKINLDKTPEFVNSYNISRLNLSLDKLRKEEVVDKVRVTENEIRDRFTTLYESVRLRHIFVKDKNTGEKILNALREGSDFIYMVEKESEDMEETKKRGGDIGFKRRSELAKEIAEVAFALREGEVSGLIETENGFHIVRIEGRRIHEGEIPEREKKSIERSIFIEKERERNTEYLISLRKNATIIINEDILKAVRGEDELDEGKVAIATINGEDIKRDDLLRRLKSSKVTDSEEEADKFKKKILDSIITNKLLDREIAKRNYEQDVDFRYSLLRMRDANLVKLFKSKIVGNAARVDNKEIEEYYGDNMEVFREPEKVRMSIIKVREKESTEKIIEELKRGADFGMIAAEMSEDPTASRNGDAGWLDINTLSSDIALKLNETEIGGIAGPFNIDNNFLIIKLDGREKGDMKGIELVRDNIAEILSKKKYEQFLNDYLVKLRSGSNIRINEAVLNGFIKHKRNLPEQMDRQNAY